MPKNFQVSKITSSDRMTITAELANGPESMYCRLRLHGEANHNAEESTVDIEFHGEEGITINEELELKNRLLLMAGLLSRTGV